MDPPRAAPTTAAGESILNWNSPLVIDQKFFTVRGNYLDDQFFFDGALGKDTLIVYDGDLTYGVMQTAIVITGVIPSQLTVNGSQISLTSSVLTDTFAPTTAATYVDGRTVSLVYNEDIDSSQLPPSSAYTVNVGGASRAISSMAVSGDRVTLTLASAVLSTDVVTVGYTDPTSGNDINAIQDLAGNDLATSSGQVIRNITEATGPVAAELHGMSYFWKSDSTGKHVLLKDVNINVLGGSQPVEGPNAPIQLKINSWDATGRLTLDIIAHSTAGFDSYQANISFGGVQNASFVSKLTSGLNEQATSANGISIAGIGITGTVGGDLTIGTLTLETGSNSSARFGVEVGSLVAKDFIEKASTPFGNTVAHVVTGPDGKYSISPIDPGTYKLEVSKSGSGLASAINVTDAQAALRLAVGGNPNPVGATGTATKISPFQFMAADVNADGKVNVMDAQAILKLAVAANLTFTPEWMFVEDTRVLNLDRKNAAWDHSINSRCRRHSANLIGVIKGDVNGSGQRLPAASMSRISPPATSRRRLPPWPRLPPPSWPPVLSLVWLPQPKPHS